MKQEILTFNMQDSNFLEHIEQDIENYPKIEIINFKDSNNRNQTFLYKLAYTEFTSYVAYFLDKGTNLYSLDYYKSTLLHSSIGRDSFSIKNNTYKANLVYTYQILRLFLHYEAEQRAYFPEKYLDLPWLKDQRNSRNCIPLERAEKFDESPAKEVVQELKKALKEQEAYYQACLEAKAKGIPLMPYHKKFLPKIELVQEQKKKTWSEKILESPNSSLRHRSKSDEPLQTKQEEVMKQISRSSDTLTKPEEEQPLLNHNGRDEESFVSRLMGWFVSNPYTHKPKRL